MNPSESDNTFVKNAIDVAAKLFLIGILLVLSFNIIEPFVLPVIWAIIIAVAFNPLINKITKLLGGRRKVACIGFSLVAVAVLVVPVVMLAGSSLDVVQEVAGDLKNNEVDFIKEAPDRVAEIPVEKRSAISGIWQRMTWRGQSLPQLL